jgi:hypothetical protein
MKMTIRALRLETGKNDEIEASDEVMKQNVVGFEKLNWMFHGTLDNGNVVFIGFTKSGKEKVLLDEEIVAHMASNMEIDFHKREIYAKNFFGTFLTITFISVEEFNQFLQDIVFKDGFVLPIVFFNAPLV